MLEFLASSVDLSLSPDAAGSRVRLPPGALRAARAAVRGGRARRGTPVITTRRRRGRATVAQPAKMTTTLRARLRECILCYKCVEACGEDAQNTFAIAVAGRGFDARISPSSRRTAGVRLRLLRQLHRRLPDRRADVAEYELRAAGAWDESAQTVTDDDLPLLRRRLHADAARAGQQDRQGDVPPRQRRHQRHLCVKGRFGWQFVQHRHRE